MTTQTLANLTSDIQSYTTYSSAAFIAQIPLFIRESEERIFYVIQLPSYKKGQTGTLTIGNPYLSLPGDFMAPASLAIIDPITNNYTYLLNKDVSYIRQVWPNPATTAPPVAYSLFQADVNTPTILMGPTPDKTYSVELNYFYRPGSLVDNPAGTWLSEFAYDALLYGALSEASNWMKRTAGIDTMGDTYEARFVSACAALKNLGEGRDRKDTYRGGELRHAEGP